jgi:RHS repeat-associated protein
LGNVTKSATTDGSGMLVDIGRAPPLLTLKDGSQIILTKIADNDFIGLTKEDTNGNQVGNTDTLNRPLITTTNGTNYTVFTINDSNGNPQTYRLDNATSVSYQTNFCGGKNNPPLSVCNELSGTRQMPSRLTLPNGTYYQFTWIQGDALELQSVVIPTGATINYTYGYLCNQPPLLPGQDALTVALDCRASVTSRTVTGAGASGTWNYSGGTVTDPSGNDEVHVFSIISLNNQKSASTYETEVDSYQGSASSGHILRRVVTDYTGELNSLDNQWLGNIRPIRKTITLDNGLVYKTETDYETFTAPAVTTATRMNRTEIREYGYGSGSPGAPLRRTDYAYLHNSNSTYANLNIVDRQNSVTTYDGLGNKAAQTTFEYDVYNHTGMPAMGVSGAVQHDATRSTSYVTRGNATAVGRWLNTTGVSLTSLNQYDDAGSVIATKDPKLNLTSFDYTDSWGNSACAPTGPGKAFPTTTTNALGQLTKYTYNSCTGNRASAKDQNDINAGRPGTMYSYDLLNRPVTIAFSDGGQTTHCYSDLGGSTCPHSGPPFQTVTTTKIASSPAVVNETSTTFYDGLGRVSQTQLNSDPDGVTSTATIYDALGRTYQVYNPTRCSAPTTNCGESTWGYTTNAFDPLGRVTSITLQDGQITTTTYSGNCTTTTDPALKTRKACSDALGRLTQILEDPAALNYETDYQYDALDNLLCSAQKGTSSGTFTNCASTPASWRPRTFTYDSLSRLVCASNPENSSAACPATGTGTYTSGTTGYVYDASGNLISKTSPAPNQTGSSTVTTTYQYDALNRLTQKSYSDGVTLPALFGYDQTLITMGSQQFNITNSIGRMSWNCILHPGSPPSCGGSMTANSYDPMGRLAELWQENPVNSNNIFVSYGYDLIGDETARSLNNLNYTATFSGAARLLTFSQTSYTNATNPPNLLTSPHYNAFGQLSLATFANGLSESWSYDKRGRLQAAAVGTNCGNGTGTCSGSSVYSFSLGFAPNSNVSTANDNVNGNWTYSYDQLNRLSGASSTSGQPCKGLSWTYDAWGNRTDQNVTAGSCGTLHAGIAGTNNRFGSPYQYDAAGNMTYDGVHHYIYDPENHIISVDNGATTYTYDALGRRAAKTTGGLVTDFIYDREGHVILTNPATPTMIEMYVAGLHLGTYVLNAAQTATVLYYDHADWLGTERARTDLSGTACEKIASLPFGDGQTITGTCGDISPRHFTGKERDTESGLDNFGARFDASNLGRFMSPDPIGGHQEDPQTMNRYSYVRNNPLNLTDPTGLDFYLQCANKNHEGCTQVKLADGLDPTWVQADKNGKANIITSDSIRAGDNTATVDENGVTINGKSQGIYFDNRASQTRDANGTVVDDHNPITLAGSGSLKDFTITLNGNCSGTCLSSGTWSYPGSLEEARVTLYGRHSFSLLGEDDAADMGFGQHAYSTQHRFGGPTCGVFSCADSPHLSVPTEAPDPKMNVPQGFHVDAHGDFYHHSQDVKRQGVE